MMRTGTPKRKTWCIAVMCLGVLGLLWTRTGLAVPFDAQASDAFTCLQIGSLVFDFQRRNDVLYRANPAESGDGAAMRTCRVTQSPHALPAPFLTALSRDGRHSIWGALMSGATSDVLDAASDDMAQGQPAVLQRTGGENWRYQRSATAHVFWIAVPVSDEQTFLFQVLEVLHES